MHYARANESLILFDGAYEAFIRDPALPRSIFEVDGARECAEVGPVLQPATRTCREEELLTGFRVMAPVPGAGHTTACTHCSHLHGLGNLNFC